MKKVYFRGGRLDYSIALGMTEYLRNERDYIPWSAAISGFNYLESMLSRTGAFGEYRFETIRSKQTFRFLIKLTFQKVSYF